MQDLSTPHKHNPNNFFNSFFIYIYSFIHLSLVGILLNHCCTFSIFVLKTKEKKTNEELEKRKEK